METIEAIKTRRSIRQYKDTPIPKHILESIIDAARYAPTARGVEPWEFVVVTDRRCLQEIAALADHGPFIAQAAAAVAVFCIDTKYYLEDGSAATQTIMLAARACGIGSCWVAGDKKPYASDISRLLGVPGTRRLVSMVSLGYPRSDREFSDKEKKPVSGLLHWERF